MNYRAWLMMTAAAALVLAGAPLSRASAAKKLLDNLHFFKTRSQFRPVILLDGPLFKRHVIQAPMNFSVVVEFTMLHAGSPCHFCSTFHQEFRRLADGYKETGGADLFFVSLEFKVAKAVFAQLGVASVPRYLVFGRDSGPGGHRAFQQSYSASAEEMAKNVRHLTGIKVDLRKYDHSLRAILVAGAFCLASLRFKPVRTAATNRFLWAVLAVAFILMFSSGTMLNFMQRPRFAGESLELKIEKYVARYGQYVAESMLVGLLYGLCTVIIIGLHASSSLEVRRPLLKHVLEVTLGLALLLVVSVLVKVYRFKVTTFPYRLLFR